MRYLIVVMMVLSFSFEALAKGKKKKVMAYTGVVVSCHDGDTCRVKVEFSGATSQSSSRSSGSSLPRSRELKVRLAGIDAPELKQEHGREAKNYTESVLKGKRVELTCDGTSFDRVTCVVKMSGEDMNEKIVANGFAFDAGKYSKGRYRLAEAEAKRNGLGIWATGITMSPYCFRHKTSKKCLANKMSVE